MNKTIQNLAEAVTVTPMTFGQADAAFRAAGATVETEKFPEGSVFSGNEKDTLFLEDRDHRLVLVNEMVGISFRHRAIYLIDKNLMSLKMRRCESRNPADWQPGEDSWFELVPVRSQLADWSYNF